ncbi:response regulator transcription factor [Parasegetibacter sp. NRK P23]|uniref:response regulator transcription factor n=1 Tax=Parasegetibacter sp. NRK P23 TaxID=2942999 RepID=UPI002042EE9E|nr:response regulator transcription factor [Parasegetibacter sp. NRK P23]MCM5529670.1 response regulator transcription factor [Parasegetibacter sp. NRK P23]
MKVLIVEDEKELASAMRTYLERENLVCEVADNFRHGMAMMESFDYDCVLLDITLPDGNGLDILKEMKASHKMDGVIIISAKDAIEDRVYGLNLGADDYLAKPFHLSELYARTAAVIRRRRYNGSNTITINELTIDLIAKTVFVNDHPVELTRKEYDLLLYLAANRNRVVSKNAIAENLAGDSAAFFDSFDFIYAHMKNLKRKLQEAGCADYIRAVYGMGYKLSA